MIHWQIADELIEILREAGLVRRFRAKPAKDDTTEAGSMAVPATDGDERMVEHDHEIEKTIAMMRQDFRDWFSQKGIRHFTAGELLFEGASHHDPNSHAFGLNRPPPRALWGNILPTLFLVDQLREDLGRPIRITSAYRSLAYNRAIGSSDASQHRRFRALDIVCDGLPASMVANRLDEWRQAGRWSGGLGRYRNFTHIDTRGRNATWSG